MCHSEGCSEKPPQLLGSSRRAHAHGQCSYGPTYTRATRALPRPHRPNTGSPLPSVHAAGQALPIPGAGGPDLDTQACKGAEVRGQGGQESEGHKQVRPGYRRAYPLPHFSEDKIKARPGSN